MSKRLERMRANPRGDWTIEDVAALCREYGIACDPSRRGSSHYKVKHLGIAEILAVPFKRPIKAIYIKRPVEIVDEVRALK